MENIFTEEQLDRVAEEFARARMAALKISPVCGAILLGLIPILCDNWMGKPVETAATDGKYLFVNPNYWDTLTIEQKKSLVLHEGWHVICGHPWRRGGRDFAEWNICTDLAIHGFMVPSGQIIGSDWLYDPKYNGWGAERIHSDKYGVKDEPEDGPWEDEPGEEGEPGGEGNPGISNGKTEPGAGEPQPHAGEVWDATDDNGNELSESEKQAALDDLAKEIVMAQEIEKQSTGLAGSTSGDQVERAIEEAISPSANWADRLKDRWASFGQPDQITYSKPSRRGLAMDFVLPSVTRKSLDTIVVAMDQSSSVDRYATNIFWTQLRVLREEVPCSNLIIMPFNSYCKEEDMIEVPEGQELPKVTRSGGGTRYSPIFNLVNRMNIRPDAIIVMTDMECSDFGEEPDCPVVWMSSDTCFDTPPFGEVIEVGDE